MYSLNINIVSGLVKEKRWTVNLCVAHHAIARLTQVRFESQTYYPLLQHACIASIR